jgi:indole-3-glycerol phosphate synthase
MILDRIFESKKREVARLKEMQPLSEIMRMAKDAEPARDFKRALVGADCSIIAEIKRRSPSKGRIRDDFNVIEIAETYEANGAAAISVLTEREFFEGDCAYLKTVKKVSSLPVLRKDFIIDPYQVYETKVLGGDALLLIAGVLDEYALKDLLLLAYSLGLFALVEVHSEADTIKAVASGADIIGINNRDLKTFTTNIERSLAVAPLIPRDRVLVSESGIGSKADIDILMKAGIRVFLVGETLMRSGDIGAALRELMGK